MPNDPRTDLTPTQQFNHQLDEQVKNFRALLPSHIPVEKFKRVVVVAISQNPELFKADRRSLFTAAQKCAADGLLPDGREAALVVYGNQAVYMPMVAGIRKRMRNSGEVLSAEAHVVYRNDKFFRKFGDEPGIVHEPPPFGTDRGDPVGAYAIIKLRNGEVLREVLDKKEIEKIRAVSKAKNGPAWTGWWDEMARKSALRRCAKWAPTSADIDTLLARDDEPAEQLMVDITPPEPEPPRAAAIEPQQEPEQYQWTVTDCDGETHDFNSRESAVEKLQAILTDAARRGPKHIEAAHENNAALLAEIGEPPHSPAGSGNPAHQPTDPEQAPQPERNDALAGSEGGLHAAPVVNQPAGDTEPRDLLGDKPALSYRVRRAGDTRDDWDAFETDIWAMIKAGDPPGAILRDNREDLDIHDQIRERALEHNRIMRALENK